MCRSTSSATTTGSHSTIPSSPTRNWNDPAIQYELLDGEQELFPGVELILTPGHAPFHQSLLITLESGSKLVLCGDAIYSQENVDRDSWATQPEPDIARESATRLLDIARNNQAFVIYGHDHVQAGELDYAPHSYA